MKGTKYVPRDASSYRQFFKKLDKVKDRYDPYTNFFLKEADFHNMTRKVLPDKIRKAKTKEEKETYQDILDNMMLTELKKEESDLNVGTHVIKRKEFHYDFETLITDQNEYDIDEETHSQDYSDEHFLHRRRRQAEANLVKTKILYKLHEDLALTENEKAYLNIWNQEIHKSRFKNLADCMVPTDHSNLSLGSLEGIDRDHLNSLPLVDVTGLEKYAVNDMVLELNNFIDSKIIQNLESEIYVAHHKHEWNLSQDFTLSERRNKEIDLVMGEIEEKVYRHAGKFDETELDGIKRMYQVNRGEGIFDEAWVSQPILHL